MKRKQFRKKILSTILAWTLITANILPGMVVQASSLSDNDVAVTQEVSSQEEVIPDTEVSEEVTISGNIEETSQEGYSDSTEDPQEGSSESLEESQEEYSDSTEDSKEEAVLGDTEKEDVEDESISENSSEAQEVVVLPQNHIAAVDVSVMAVADTTEYEIYPTPHSMTYGDGGYEVGNVNLVYDSGFNDAATKNRMEEILRSKNISFTNGNKIASGKTNILIGIYSADNKGYAQTELEKAETVTAADFDKITAHYVVSKNNTIYVLGKDVDAAFYGVTTLKHVFAQMNDKVIRNFTVKDYADVAIRGFIEGYYGIPWSNEDRMSLMEFGGDFKMTSYVFAPKDDIYHTTKWRELYPDDEIAKIREMVAVGNASKCRFVWTAHPFMNGGNFGGGGRSVEAEIQALLNKFDQLYDAGVRQFGVLSDDVSGVSYAMIIQVMKAVSQWAISKGDVYDTVFCPQGYNHSWQSGGYGQNYAELNAFDPEFPDNIQIFWTGESVCQPIIPLTLEHFMTHNLSQGAEARRAPLFWLNWPVNDINHSRMVMGKGSQMKTDVNPQHLAGVVTNPLQEAEASKNALFAVADYTWNIANFDEDQSWEDGFKYIEPDATEELHTLAKHMSDPSPNTHGLNLEESADIKELLEAYIANGTGGEQLIEEFETIAAACDNFHLKSKNENLKDELLPFTNSLKDLVNAGIKFIETQAAIDNGDEDLVWSSYSQASALLRNSRTYVKPTRSVPEIVDPGSKRIIPFVESLNTKLSPTVMSMVDDSKQFVTFITNRSDFSSNILETVTDNDEATQVIGKNPNTIATGDYVGLSFTKGEEVTSITFKMGHSDNANDSFSSAKLEYTTNGKDWLTVPGSEYTDNRGTVSVTGLNLTGVKGVRLIATADKTNTWLGIKDILINGKGFHEKASLPGNKYAATFFKPDRYTVYEGNVGLISDENDSTFIWFGVNCNKDDAIGIDLGETKEVGSIHFAMPAGDCMSNYSIQYSTNNSNWTKLGDYTALITDIDLNSSPIQARYIRVVSNANTNKWLKIAELTARDPYVKVYPVYTNKEEAAVASMTANVGVDTSTLTGNVTLAPGEYVGVDMERIKDVTSITADFTGNVKLQLSKNEVIWYEYDLSKPIAAYEEARFVRFINAGTENVSLNITSLEVKSFEVAPISVKATSFSNQGSHLLAFDQDRTTEAILQGSQNAGQYIIYDLGQTIDLESLKLVLHDSTTDYPRHAKVSVSKDNSAWEPIMLIGNQDAANPGEEENTDSIFDLFPIHDISYNILEQDNINLEVRYIKFEITRTKVGADKWVRIREIELNGGDLYMPEENNPVIQSGAGEDYGNTFSNMLDGDVSTLYTPMKNESGEFVYNIPGNTAISQVTILQNPMAISEATVTARVVENGEEKEVTLGNISGSLNRFATDKYEGVLAITVAWEKDKLPGIYEIILDRKAGSISNNTIVKQLAHTVSFNSMGGTEVESRMVEDNGKVAKPINPTKEGFRFAGWYLGDTAYDFTAPITSSITLTAKWTEIIYHTVSFNSMGGSEVEPARVEDKEKVSKPSDPIKEGFRFTGWYQGDTAYDFTSPVTESITLTAKWTEIVYHTVSFNSMGGSEVESVEVEDKGKVSKPADPTKEGFTFAGWYLEETAYDFASSVTESITLTARWTEAEAPKPDIDYGEILEEDRENLTELPEGIWVAGIENKVYNSTKQLQKFRVYDGNKMLQEKKDYTVSYKNNQNASQFTDEDWETFESKSKEDTKLKSYRTFVAAKAPQVVIKMKGDYSGSKTIYFKIDPLDIEANCFAQNLAVVYNKRVQKPKPVVTRNGKALVANKDYTFEITGYPTGKTEAKDVGTYVVTIRGKGNFAGRTTVDFVIADPTASLSKAKVAKIANIVWSEKIGTDGAEPKPAVKLGTTDLKEGTDFTYSYKENTAVGTGYVTITGNGSSYFGSKTVSFKITGTSIANITYDKLPSYPYQGEEIKPLDRGVVIKDKKTAATLEKDKHFFVTYQKNENRGTGSMTLTGNPEEGYTGTKKISFKIDAAKLDSSYKVSFIGYEDKQVPYTATAVTPKVEVRDAEGNVLAEGTDYTVKYKNNKKVGSEATATVNGKGNYTGSLTEGFTIVKKAVTEGSDDVTIKVLDKVEKAGKNGWKQTFKVVDANGKVINKNEYSATYTLVGSDEALTDTTTVDAGKEICVTVTFEADSLNYAGTVSETYRIIKKGYDISKASISVLPQDYTGSEIKLTSNQQFKTVPYVKNGRDKLYLYLETEGSNVANMEVVEGSYVKNVNKGTAKVTLRGIGEFGGEKTVSFKIVQRNILSNWWKDLMNKEEIPEEDVTIRVAAIETAYGSNIWVQVAEAFTEETGIEVELTTDKNLEDVIGPSMQRGEYPDVVHLATGRPAGLTEQLIKGNLLTDITDVLSMKVPGETALVSEKLAGGFTETYLTNPYGNGKTYLAPMFYSPCGLFYNAGLLEEKGWALPTTWDEMWELGEKAKEEGIALFTYPTTGYLDAFFYSLMYSIGGDDFFNAVTNYEEGTWETEEADKYFEIIGKLADYTHSQTPDNANYEDFTKNQQMVLNNQAIFMPNGTWIVGEMAQAPKAEGFEWGMTALPAVEDGGSGYSYSWFEQSWIPEGAANVAAAKQFVAFLYSDVACEIFASAGAIQPVLGISEKLTGSNKMFYSVYDNGAKAAMGNFKAFTPISGIEISSVYFEPMNDLVKDRLTVQTWKANIIAASDSIRESLE